MTKAFDVVVIGAGANGMTAAAVLSRAGMNVLLLEQSDTVGGQSRVIEFAPGFRASPITVHAGWVPPAIAREIGLMPPTHADAPISVAVARNEYLTLWRDSRRAGDGIRRYSARDAEQWTNQVGRLQRLAGFIAELYQQPAPDIEASAAGELVGMLKTARKLRNLGKADMIEFLRIMPMAVQELVDDWFEAEPLKAALAASGVRSIRQGPRSGGTTFVLLHHMVGAPPGAIRNASWWPTGGATFVGTAERAARKHGVTIRTTAEVSQIMVADDAVTGVVLTTGEEIATKRVLSTGDPKRTLLDWLDPVWLDPEFLHAVRNIKFRGSTATVLYGLNALPEFEGLDPAALRGVISLSPDTTTIERAADAAKYGRVAQKPHIELSIPSLFRREGEVAPAGQHLLVARAQSAPYALGAGWDDAQRDALTKTVTAAITAVVPNFESLIEAQATYSPADLEQLYGITEGATTHGELTLDQILFMRPLPGWGRYTTPIRGLYLGGAGSHPGPDILGGAGYLAAAQVLAKRKQQ